VSDGQAIRSALGSTLRNPPGGGRTEPAGLAEKADLSPAHISDVERGVKDLSSDRVARACAALDLLPAELFGEVTMTLREPAGAANRPPHGVWLARSAERLSPQALRTVAEFSAYLASKEPGGGRRKIGFEF